MQMVFLPHSRFIFSYKSTHKLHTNGQDIFKFWSFFSLFMWGNRSLLWIHLPMLISLPWHLWSCAGVITGFFLYVCLAEERCRRGSRGWEAEHYKCLIFSRLSWSQASSQAHTATPCCAVLDATVPHQWGASDSCINDMEKHQKSKEMTSNKCQWDKAEREEKNYIINLRSSLWSESSSDV